ncbi:glyoxalase/bleomycin resistance protein/dioxygenase [Streptomyces sp. 150FB]|uniref:VOC family protein n=1 Tax=Streptomyces sp. 150FB TaxID=1576605 RepID=UPI0005892229|nr:VOC family protein [Streptomyces sp. 150FB]KIF76713.1 glyoxalase/bleomycin resistance protein/dioxygenase [Streptomyces sp. 150FB]
MARDLDRSRDFYAAVLGWTFRRTTLGEEFTVAFDGRSPVAGIGALAAGLRVSVAWIPYFGVEGADVTAARVRERGATVAVGPLALPPGRGVLAADPDGAVFGFWEGRTVRGWSVGQGAGPAGLELRTRDAFAAAIFYAEVLGWASTDDGRSCDVRYEQDRVLVVDNGDVVAALRGGAVESAPDPQVRPRWHVSFRVPDADAAAEAAEAAGGTVVAPPTTAYAGTRDGRTDHAERTERTERKATLRDPDGAQFTVVAAVSG